MSSIAYFDMELVRALITRCKFGRIERHNKVVRKGSDGDKRRVVCYLQLNGYFVAFRINDDRRFVLKAAAA